MKGAAMDEVVCKNLASVSIHHDCDVARRTLLDLAQVLVEHLSGTPTELPDVVKKADISLMEELSEAVRLARHSGDWSAVLAFNERNVCTSE
jgi:hypothetical protein